MNTQQFPLSHQAGITLVRISLGVIWIAHALLKLLVFTLPGTAQYFQSIGLPGWLAYWVFAVEIIGGLALVMGIYARQAAIALLPIMVAATVVHIPNGWMHTSAGGGWEYPLFLSIMSVALWLAGDGVFALKSSSRFSFSLISKATKSTQAAGSTKAAMQSKPQGE